jgi:FkbM family methyltransferase
MSRPLLLRIIPVALRTHFYYRFYRSNRLQDKAIFENADLYFAPTVKMSLNAKDEGHGCIAFTGFYELSLSRRISYLAKFGGLFVDIGANYGYFSLLWAAQRPENRVVAFEASPRNHFFLDNNVKRNHLSDSIELHKEAVGKDNCFMKFDLGPENQTSWGGIVLSQSGSQVTEVPVVRLDKMVASDVFVDVLKIDIEGADFWALIGAEGLLKSKRIGRIFYEENIPRMKSLGINPSDAKNFLLAYGYKVEQIEGGPNSAVAEFEAYPA